MPLELPNLDDRTYDDLVKEALSLIPTYAPEWTNHNPSDPGITLIELFAYLTEMLIYRLNRVTNANKQAFLNLINGPEWREKHPKPLGEDQLNEEIRKAVLMLRQSDRAITCADFETLALKNPQVARARCLPQRNLELENPLLPPETHSGHVSVVIIPTPLPSVPSPVSVPPPQPSDDLLSTVKSYLDERRLLTTQVHVVGPRYLTIGVQITLTLKSDTEETTARPKVVAALEKFFDPLRGGDSGNGWSFGRNIYVSELYELLDQLREVDYVSKTMQQGKALDEIMLSPKNFNRHKLDRNQQLTAIEVRDDELVNFQLTSSRIEIITPVRTLDTNNAGGR